MPLPNIPVPQFPTVPLLPGVPQLVRAALGLPTNPVSALGSPALQSQLWASSQSAPTWGVFESQSDVEVADDGTVTETPTLVQVLFPDSVLNFDNRNEWNISKYPVQKGSFTDYNKVVVPFETSVRMSKGGNLLARSTFLQQIAAIAGNTNLYTILTPEVSYLNCNITRYEVTRRGAEGAYFLCEVDVYFEQILQVDAQYSTNAANTSNAKNPAALPPVNQGNIQPQGIIPSIAASKAAAALANVLN